MRQGAPSLAALRQANSAFAISLLGLVSPSIARHCRHVAELARHFSSQLMIAEPLRLEIFRTALLHDIGLLATLPMEDIQRATSCLYLDGSDDDHAEFGAQLVSLFPDCTRASEWIRHHHERYDGTGYPDSLRGTRIPLGSRIISVADSWDCFLFAEGLAPAEALTKLEELAGSVLDPQLVEAFADCTVADFAVAESAATGCVRERAVRVTA